MRLILYKSPLNPDELSFLRQKEKKQRKQFYNLVRYVMLLCFICPFAGAWIKAVKGDELAFSYAHYFLGVGFLTAFCSIWLFWAYRINLYKTQKDIATGTKTIETVFITRKQYMASNNTYYFYLSTPKKLSIEVNENDYRAMNKGDELQIAYTSFSEEYLGYL